MTDEEYDAETKRRRQLMKPQIEALQKQQGYAHWEQPEFIAALERMAQKKAAKKSKSSQKGGGLCHAIKQDGTGCSRKAEGRSRYCWQHN